VSEIECTLSVLDKNTDEYCSRICYMQDVSIAGYRTQQGREQIVFRHMQFMRQQEISDSYQIRFHGTSRKAQEDECLVAWNKLPSFQASKLPFLFVLFQESNDSSASDC
jgi:hypothetical protein